VGFSIEERDRALRYLALGLDDGDAFVLAERDELARLFETALEAGLPVAAKSIAKLTVHDVGRELKKRGKLAFGGGEIAELAEMIDEGKLSSALAKELLAEMAVKGGRPRAIAEALGLNKVSDASELEPLIDAVLTENADAVARYRNGKPNLLGFFVGLVMKRSAGKADPALLRELLQRKLG
jgi:glutaminyl-tRNA synthetase